MILRVNAVCAIIVFCFRSFCQRILWDFVPSVVLACQELGIGYVHFNLNEDLKICQNLMTLTRMQAESQRKVKVKSLSRVRLFATPWTVAHQAPPSMGFSRQEYWSGVPLCYIVSSRSGPSLIFCDFCEEPQEPSISGSD